jgi:hypothetical protein
MTALRLFLLRFLMIILCFCLGCTGQGKSDLSRGLIAMKKDRKISEKKSQVILKEYDSLQKADSDKSKLYSTQLLTIIKYGGDSSHLDQARRQILKAKKSNNSK